MAYRRRSKLPRAVLNLVLLETLTLLSSAEPLTITRAPQAPALPLVARQAGGISSCVVLNSIASSCAAATTSFFDQPFSVAATCLCYSASDYQPTIYDNAIETCLEYLSTASPPLYTSLAAANPTDSPCAAVGNVRTNTVVDTYLISCSSWYSLEASCSSDSVLASAPAFSIQASCLCYTSSMFAPTVFDGYWDGCLEYYKTASSEYYYDTLATKGNLETPCARVGDVRASGTATATATSGSAAPGQTGSGTSGATSSETSSVSIATVTTGSSAPTGATNSASIGPSGLLANTGAPGLGGVKRVVPTEDALCEIREAKRTCKESVSADWQYVRVEFPSMIETGSGRVCGVGLKVSVEERKVLVAFNDIHETVSSGFVRPLRPLAEIFLPPQIKVSSVTLMREKDIKPVARTVWSSKKLKVTGNIPNLSPRQFLFMESSGTLIVDLDQMERGNCDNRTESKFILCLDAHCTSHHDRFIRLRDHMKVESNPVCTSTTWAF